MTGHDIDAVELEILRNQLESVAEEMGEVLIRGAFSPNITERRDCSTALFDAEGNLVAQAEHIPVHLGAMPEAVDAVLAADPEPHALAIVCNPNNPTGEAVDAAILRTFANRCRAAGTTLLADEAFLGFTDEPSLAGRPGCVVARSLTKLFGLPGLRMGYAAASGDLLDRLVTARRAWSMSAPSAAVGAHCYRQPEFVERTRERIDGERARMRRRLAARFDVAPSDAPFLLLTVEEADAVDDLLAATREQGIALRDARTFRGLDSHVRVAVRTEAENDRLLDALDV